LGNGKIADLFSMVFEKLKFENRKWHAGCQKILKENWQVD